MVYVSRNLLITAIVVLAIVFILGYMGVILGVAGTMMGFAPYGFLWAPVMMAIFIIIIVLAVYALIRSITPGRRPTRAKQG